jgi:putative NADPH-quinone reductase
MQVLLVYCHPVPESFCAALRDRAIAALCDGGHDVDLIDLYRDGFDPVMNADERRTYNETGRADHPLPEYVRRLNRADALVFVFPTWWYGLPAMLKGWLDRVITPGVGFDLPDRPGPIKPLLTHVDKIAVISTCGAPRWFLWWVGNPGRKTILRGIRALCGRRCKTMWLAHYRMDASTPESRTAFLHEVENRLRRF